MNFLTVIILYCISCFKGERSTNAVYYLLQGKKSAQTVQDAVWFSLKHVFSIYPELKKELFQEHINFLAKNKLIEINDKTCQITTFGQEKLTHYIERQPIPEGLNGWNFQHIDKKFWQRLSLIVQIVSNWTKGEGKFMPVQRDFYTQRWVKRWLYDWNSTYDKQTLTKKLYLEIEHLLTYAESKNKNPEFFVARLSGYENPGLTISQIAQQYKIDEFYYLIIFRSFLHFMIKTISDFHSDYPLLYSIIKNDQQEIVFTESTRKTLNLININKSIKEIARIRNLKVSTIEDHIVEIALMDEKFSIDPYVTPSMQERIRLAIKTLNTRKLKRIKEAVPDADYFAIRLVLSKWTEQK